MAMPNRPGRFRATVLDRGVSETGSNNLLTFIIRFLLTQESTPNGDWQDIEIEGMEITAYVYLEKKDGSINDRAVEDLKKALGWPGDNPFWLEGRGDPPNTGPEQLPDCQVTLDWEEYKGKRSIRVQWINPYDSEGGGIQHSTDDVRKRVLNRLGPKLRAMAGGTPAAKPAANPTGNAPARTPPAAPATPPPAAAPPTAPPAAKPARSTSNDAWAAFCAHEKAQGLTDAVLQNAWFACIKQICGHDNQDRVTPEQWGLIAEAGPSIPF